jgi:hypothetical protein
LAAAGSVAHGATDIGLIRRPARSNVIGPTCPPVRVTNVSTVEDAMRHEGCPSTVRSGGTITERGMANLLRTGTALASATTAKKRIRSNVAAQTIQVSIQPAV